MAAPPIQISVWVKKATEKALLVEVDGEEVWLPRSQIVEDESEALEEGDTGTLAITQWIAREKGLE